MEMVRSAIEGDRGVGQRLHDVGDDLARDDRLALLLDVGRDHMANRDGEVVRLELEGPLEGADIDAREDGKG